MMTVKELFDKIVRFISIIALCAAIVMIVYIAHVMEFTGTLYWFCIISAIIIFIATSINILRYGI